MNNIKKMSDLQPGECARIEMIEQTETLGFKLQELGFIPGTSIKLIRRAPMGDPLEIKIHGTHLCLRQEEAAAVSVCTD